MDETLDERTETLGERLRRLRLDRGLTQRDLAMPGVGYAMISRIENGERRPGPATMKALAERLGVPLSELADGGQDEMSRLRLKNRQLREENQRLTAALATTMNDLAELRAGRAA